MKTISTLLLVAVVIPISSCKDKKSYSGSVQPDIQYVDRDGHICCVKHQMRLVEVDGYVPKEMWLVDPTIKFTENTKLFPNHLMRIHASLDKSEDYSEPFRVGFCIKCEEGFNAGMRQPSELINVSEQDRMRR